MRALIIVISVLLIGALVWSETSAGELLPTSADGWHTWQVDEPDVSNQMCCFSWRNGKSPRGGCNLDGGSMAFTDSGDCAAASGTIQVYVRFDSGTPEDIRVLSSNCPVSTESEVTDHGLVSVDENLGWFRGIIESKHLDMDVREEALFGLIQSESDAAFAYLDRLLTQN